MIDLFLVLTAILLIVIMWNPLNLRSQDHVVVVENPGEANMRMLIKDGQELEHNESNGEIVEGQGAEGTYTPERWKNDLGVAELRGVQ